MKKATHDDQIVGPIKAAKLLLKKKLITTDQMSEAMVAQADWGSDLGQVLIGKGYIKAKTYYEAVAEVSKLSFVDLQKNPPDQSLLQAEHRHDYIVHDIIPWRQKNGRIILAVTDVNPDIHQWAARNYGVGKYEFVITSKFDVLWTVQKAFDMLDDLDARESLYQMMPQHSAKTTFTVPQIVFLYCMACAVLVGVWFEPRTTLVALAAVVSFFYLLSFAFKFLLTWLGSSRKIDVQVTHHEVSLISDSSLPIYTILVPMYREARVLPLLIDAIRKLDYPKAKLDVKLVLEADDTETIEAAKAQGAASIFEIIRVPHSYPKTKPKACNYAMRFAKGEFLAIFDAEDMPEPDQLKKVLVAFRKSPPEVACIQARLNYFNRLDNFLTRMFTLEYSQWFDFLLPGLHALRIPIPLGGTSNHFRLDVLNRLGAWDPYNVTEDADLGVRLTQEGYQVSVVNSTTFEEATSSYGSWIKQRSRWVKGYMLTYLVHMRNPWRLYRSLGHSGFWGFQFFIGGPPLIMLLNPILWILFAVTLIFPMASLDRYVPLPILYVATFNLIVANLMYVYFGVVAAFKRHYYDLVPYGLLQPFYWVLHSIAAYKALFQLIFKPHYWEKTQHGNSASTQKVLTQISSGDHAHVS